jgi:cardiolipin synthase C
MRMEMIGGAERTLDLQYYIFRGDESGRLLTDALVRAADRGVAVRVLVDDGNTIKGDEQLFAFARHRNVEIRVFNPFRYRGHNRALRAAEFLFNHPRLDYRMHNKLLIADGAIALAGGRNIGNQYFQIDPESQFADDDVFAGGPVVRQLAHTFDAFWNGDLAVPVTALGPVPDATPRGKAHAGTIKSAGFDYQTKLAAGEPLSDVLSGALPLVWANAQVVFDSPDKRRLVTAGGAGSLLYEGVAPVVAAVGSELLTVSPYVIPSHDETDLIKHLRQREVRVRILTNSPESAPELSAYSRYMHVRPALLREGVELNEVRARPGKSRGTGQPMRLSRFGNYGLHAKLFVFDRAALFIGSMNWDQRSRRINTELGLVINSATLAQQLAGRFVAMAQPENSYSVTLRTPAGASDQLVWKTVLDGKPIEFTREPARNSWQRFKVHALAALPLDSEL